MKKLLVADALPDNIECACDRSRCHSFQSRLQSAFPPRNARSLLDHILNRGNEAEQLYTAEFFAERRILRLKELLFRMQPELEEAPSFVPMALDSPTWTRILLQARRLPPNMSEGAIARWVISQSYMLIPLDFASLLASLEEAGFIRFRADGHVEYQLLGRTQAWPQTVLDKETGSTELDSGHSGALGNGQYLWQSRKKRIRPRLTAPLLSPAVKHFCLEAVNSFATRAVLCGLCRPWSKTEQITSKARRRSSSGNDRNRNSGRSSSSHDCHDWKEDDPRVVRRQAALADAKARKTRRAERRTALFEKHGFFFFSQC